MHIHERQHRYPFRRPGEVRVTYKILPEKVGGS
jgi:hypothetical protein